MTSASETRFCGHCDSEMSVEAYICAGCGEWRSDAARRRSEAKSWRIPTIVLGVFAAVSLYRAGQNGDWASPALWVLVVAFFGVAGLTDYYSRLASKLIGRPYNVWTDW